MPTVLITARYFAVDPEPLDLLRAHGCALAHSELDWTLGDANVPEDRAVELLQGVDAAIISSVPLTDRVLARAGGLKVIAIRGAGYDSVDIPAATARGIPVIIAPGFTESVADYTFGLMLAVTRQVARADRLVRDGRWEVLVSTDIFRKTLGIVGLGRIGKAVARRARGFDMTVLAADEVQDPAFARQYGVTYLSLRELLQRADIDLVCTAWGIDGAQFLVGDEIDGVADGRIMRDAALEFRPVAAEDFAEQVDAGARDIAARRRQILGRHVGDHGDDGRGGAADRDEAADGGAHFRCGHVAGRQ